MERQIFLPGPIRKEMAEVFKLGRNELSRALAYERNTAKAKMLRIAALERGGVIYTGVHAPKGFCPDVETGHDHATRTMTQRIGDRVALVVSRDTNTAMIEIDGEPVATFREMTLGAWGDVLYALQQIYNQLDDK